MRRIGVLTGGGDAPGLNAAISAVVKTAAISYGWEVLGVRNGLHGLLSPTETLPLTIDRVDDISASSGTILGGASKGVFTPMLDDPQYDPAKCRAHYEDAARNVRELAIDAIVVIGGDGTQRITSGLAGYGIRAVGVPKTIDNDLYGTDRAIGFDTAVSKATKSLDSMRATAASHDRVMVMEVMGRNAGWIALQTGLNGADVILIPEVAFSMDAVAEGVSRGLGDTPGSVVVVAEGATEAGAERIHNPNTGSLGGIGLHVAAGLEQRTGKESRCVVESYQLRGEPPTASDRGLAARLGARAVRAIAAGQFDRVIVLRGDALECAPMSECVGRIKTVPPDHEFIVTARNLGIRFGDQALAGPAPEATPSSHLVTS